MKFVRLAPGGSLASFALMSSMSPVVAQQGMPTGWSRSINAETVHRGTSDLDDGGEFSAMRNIIGFGVRHSSGGRNSVSFAFSLGTTEYDFGGTVDPWERINDFSLAVPITLEVSDNTTAIVVPIVRYNGESGVDLDDGNTLGFIAAASWQISDQFSFGPGIGVFNTLDKSDKYDVFPILLINWQINDQLSVGNGGGFGASQGPAIGIKYQDRDDLSVGLFVRRDNTEFRLDKDGMAPDGVGKDKVTSVVATASYQPSTPIDISGFLGAELGGQLRLTDSDGKNSSSRITTLRPL